MIGARGQVRGGVIVAIPTFNRSQKLDRAVRSVLAQDYSDLTVLISDNASTDDTPRICETLARDARVVVHRQPQNIGLTANFNWLMRRALDSRGRADRFFMFLGDDDWLEPSYVRMCVRALDPDHSMAAGRTLCHVGNQSPWFAPDVRLDADDGLERVADFCRNVLPTGVFSGLMRLDTLARLPPQRNVIGNDWLLFANIAFLGKVRTVEQTAINRSAGGASTTSCGLAATLGVSRIQASKPLLTVASFFLQECLIRSPIFRCLPLRRRMQLATVVLISLAERKLLALSTQSPPSVLLRAEGWLQRLRSSLLRR